MLKKNIVNASIWAFVFALCMSALITISAWWGEEIEELVAPPLFRDVSAVVVDIDEQHVDILVTGIKNRGCTLTSFVADVNVREAIIRTENIVLLKQDGTPLKVEDQRIAVGSPFARLVRISPIGNFVTAYIESRCHPFWPSTQQMFFIEIPNALVR